MRPTKINASGKTVLVIPDIHAPYHHKKIFKFLKYLKKKYKPDIIIFLGDEVDGHSWSFHDSDPDLDAPGPEFKKAASVLQTIHKIFPKAHLLHSNHGSLFSRKLKKHGLPIAILRPLPELYKTPGWVWTERILLQTRLGLTMLGHGMSAKAGEWAKDLGVSTIEGHYHTKFHITWHINALRSYYSIHSGCLIDYDSYAFAYAKQNIKEPCIGATIIHPSGNPELVPLEGVKL